jgi:hypothetical protein
MCSSSYHVPVLLVPVNLDGYVRGGHLFSSVGFVEPNSSGSSMQFAFYVLEYEDFFCLFGICKFDVLLMGILMPKTC